MHTLTEQAVGTTTAADAGRAVGVITLAFVNDPATRWVFPEAEAYLTHFPAMIRAFGGRAVGTGTADYLGDYVGAAFWLPPGVSPDEEALMALFQARVPEPRRSELFSMFEQMAGYRPKEPHWYLPLIGVDPRHQGQGYGSVLLRHATERCDRDGLPAYLESSNPANIPLYERHGFRLLGTIQVGSSPPVYPMLRPKQL